MGAFGQNLTLSEILAVRTMDIAEAEEFLIGKGWDFDGAKNEGFFSVLSFAYKMNSYDGSAESFMDYSYYDAQFSIISFLTKNENKYMEYLSQIKKRGAKLIASYIDDEGALIKEYQDSTLTYTIKIIKAERKPGYKPASIYVFKIYTNELYQGRSE